MSEPSTIELNNRTTYKVNSVPCRIRYTGVHPSISKHLIKIEENDETITYLRGRKLHGKALDFQGHIIAKDDITDDVKSLGRVESVEYFEREGVNIDQVNKINEFVKLSELIHG